MSDFEDECVFWDALRRFLGLPEDYDWADGTAALARIEAENERLRRLAVGDATRQAEVERLRADNAEHLKANTATAKGLHRAQEEVSRLRRIEEAARVFGGIWDAIDATADDPDAPGVSWNVVEASLSALRSALKEKP